MSTPITVSPTTPYGSLIESRVRVVTWNLWWRYGDWRSRGEAIAETLKALEPDLVCLQEVWQEGGENQAAQLAKQLGLQHAFAQELTEGSVAQGMALLSRWPLRDVAQRALPPTGVKTPNLALRAFVDGPRGPLLVTSTHLTPLLHRSDKRDAQVRALVEFVAEADWRSMDEQGRTIIAGDFNASPDADEIRLLTGRRTPHKPGWVFLDAWETGGDGSPGYTVTKNNPNSSPLLLPNLRFDYVFVRWPSGRPGGVGHPAHVEIAGAEPKDGVVPSDHYAVVADLRY
jgi:endonuclease/exonuclease/phosphatase family metal-dependent hydrolase